MAERARLRRSGKEVVENAESPSLLMPGTEDIVEVRFPTWGEIVLGWVRPSALFLLLTGVLLLLLYVGSAATNIFFANVNNQGYVVARGTFVGNVAPLNARVYASTSTADGRNLLANVRTGFLGAPDAAVVRIRSGLFDQLRVTNGMLYVNDRPLGPAGRVSITGGNGTARLSRQYVVECQQGACGGSGTLLVLPQANVYGEVKRG